MWTKADVPLQSQKQGGGNDEAHLGPIDGQHGYGASLANSRAKIIKMFLNALKYNNIRSCVIVVPEPLKGILLSYLKTFEKVKIME